MQLLCCCSARSFGAKVEAGETGDSGKNGQHGGDGKGVIDSADAEFHLLIIPLKMDRPVQQEDFTAKKKTRNNFNF